MAYRIAARFYAEHDQFGEAYVLISDNSEKDTKLEVGSKVGLKKIEQVVQAEPVEPAQKANVNSD